MAEQMMQHKAGDIAAKQTIPAGYKQTEVGVIPEDWEVFQLGDLSDFVTSGSRGWAKYYSKSGALFIRSQNVRDGKLCFVDSQYVNIPQGIEGGRTKVKLNDLLITITGNSVGNVALASQEFEEAYISQHVGLVRLKDSSIGSYVCRYLSPNAPGNLQIQESQSGQSKPGLNLQNLKDFLVAVPKSKEEAKKITSALDDTDALIVGLELVIAKKQAIKTATMQQLLTGKSRLLGFSDGWYRQELKNLVSTPITDGPHTTPTFRVDGVPFLSVNNLVNNRINLSELRFISKEDDDVFSKKCKPQIGDVLLGKAASVGKVAIVDTDFDFNIWSPIALIRPNGLIKPKFLYYQLLSADALAQITLLTNSSSQGNIGMGDIEKIQISFPCIEEQSAIATILSDMDSELTALEQKLAKARDLKQGMMQQLLTGRIRLPLEVRA